MTKKVWERSTAELSSHWVLMSLGHFERFDLDWTSGSHGFALIDGIERRMGTELQQRTCSH